jgi:hypothetical protein
MFGYCKYESIISKILRDPKRRVPLNALHGVISQKKIHLLARWFAEIFFDSEDGGDTFLRNVGYHSTHYTASYPRRKYSSKPPL